MYSCNLLGPDMKLFAPSMKPPILVGAPFALKGPVISLLGAAVEKPVWGKTTKTARHYHTEKGTEPDAFQMQQFTFAEEHLAALFSKGRALQVA